MNEKPLFTISKLAKSAGVGVETIRFYERRGLIKQPKRGRTSFREYAIEDAGRVRFVKKAQEIGFTLKEIKALFALEQNSKVRCSDLKQKVDQKVKEIEEKSRDLHRIRKSLKKLSAACEEGIASVKECRISDCFQKECC